MLLPWLSSYDCCLDGWGVSGPVVVDSESLPEVDGLSDATLSTCGFGLTSSSVDKLLLETVGLPFFAPSRFIFPSTDSPLNVACGVLLALSVCDNSGDFSVTGVAI